MKLVNNKLFWKKFARFALVGLAMLVLFAGAQNGLMGNTKVKGPQAVLADADNCATDPNQLGCDNPGSIGETFVPVDSNPAPDQPAPQEPVPAPAAPAAQVASGPYITSSHAGCIGRQSCWINEWSDGRDDHECYGEIVGQCGVTAPAPAAPAAPVSQPAQAAPKPAGYCADHNLAAGTFFMNNNECRVCNVGGDSSPANQASCGIVQTQPQTQTQVQTQTQTQTQTQAQLPAVVCPAGTSFINGVCMSNKVGGTTNIGSDNGNSNGNSNGNNNGNNNGAVVTINNSAPVYQYPVVRLASAGSECPSGYTRTVETNGVITCAAPAPVVVAAATTEAKKMPATGLPIVFWAAAAFVPAGLKFRKFGKGIAPDFANPNYIWDQRNLG